MKKNKIIGSIIFVVVIILVVIVAKDYLSEIKTIYYYRGSTSLYETYTLTNNKENYKLDYYYFNSGTSESSQKIAGKNNVETFIASEEVVDCDYYKKDENEGASNMEYYYVTKGKKKVCLKVSDNTSDFYNELIEE